MNFDFAKADSLLYAAIQGGFCMKIIIIKHNVSVSVSNKVWRSINSYNRCERRMSERLSEREILIGDEAELDILLDKTSHNPCEIVERQELFQEIMKIIEKELTEEERRLIIEVFFSGKARIEVAESVGITYKQLTYRLKSAIKKVREIYNKK